MHRLAVMSKDGDWIAREEPEALGHILSVLESRGARYRFGAPLDVRWMAGGWSSHFEFRSGPLRVRTDFVTRPPRVPAQSLAGMWAREERARVPVPFVDALTLVELKKTNRERDYAVIGELARLLDDPLAQLLCSRSARDLVALAHQHPALFDAAVLRRPLLRQVSEGGTVLEAALDAERRELIHANERRLQSYMHAARTWEEAWPAIAAGIEGLPLRAAHHVLVGRAELLLPFHAEGCT